VGCASAAQPCTCANWDGRLLDDSSKALNCSSARRLESACAASAAACGVGSRVDSVNLGLGLCDGLGDPRCVGRRLSGEASDLIGNDGEAAAVLAGPRGLDCRVQGEQLGLPRDAVDHRGHAADIAQLALSHALEQRRKLLGHRAQLAETVDQVNDRREAALGAVAARVQRLQRRHLSGCVLGNAPGADDVSLLVAERQLGR